MNATRYATLPTTPRRHSRHAGPLSSRAAAGLCSAHRPAFRPDPRLRCRRRRRLFMVDERRSCRPHGIASRGTCLDAAPKSLFKRPLFKRSVFNRTVRPQIFLRPPDMSASVSIKCQSSKEQQKNSKKSRKKILTVLPCENISKPQSKPIT